MDTLKYILNSPVYSQYDISYSVQATEVSVDTWLYLVIKIEWFVKTFTKYSRKEIRFESLNGGMIVICIAFTNSLAMLK